MGKKIEVACLRCPGGFDYGQHFTDYFTGYSHLWPEVNVRLQVFDMQGGELDQVLINKDSFHGFLITGSAAGAYEDIPWIHDLKEAIAELYSEGRRLVGICFGHQVIAAALGGKVEKNRKGWGLGVRDFSPTEISIAHLNRLRQKLGFDPESKSSLSLIYSHQDHVLPEALPPLLESMGGTTQHAPILGCFSENILTFQGHPEFNPSIATEILARLTDRGLIPRELPEGESLEGIRSTLSIPCDSRFVAESVVGFLLQ